MPGPRFTPAASRFIRKFLRAMGPDAGVLQRRFRAAVSEEGFTALQMHALSAITPSGLRDVTGIEEHIGYHAARLARMNVTPEQVGCALEAFDRLLPEGHEPAREQLSLATAFWVQQAYYRVRESESQAFFGIEKAEVEAADSDAFLRSAVRVLTRAFRARTGRFLPEAAETRARYVASPCAELPGCASYWAYPMKSGGVILLGFVKPYPWLAREFALLEAIAFRCDEAVQRDAARARMRALHAEARSAEEQERRRIGRDLHDEAGQSLMLLRLQLEMLERDAGPEFRGRLAEIRGIAENTIAELRRIISALSPAVLERLGMEAAVRQLAGRFQRIHGGELRMRIGRLPRLPAETQEVVYRAAQELLQNAAKYSQAKAVNLSLGSADKYIRLCVSDNGAGFRADRAKSEATGFGLLGLRERAAMVGGSVCIRSKPGKGTRITLLVPAGAQGVNGNVEDSRTFN
ncbi:MAG TPA: sensor histidine kinase [Candidatus Limnocylindrales bacterium]|nr:sensor histidine kinase [Candidatus Limnocylindrales bacterium]